MRRGQATVWVAAERLPELQAVQGDLGLDPAITAPPQRAAVAWTRASAAVELLRGRLALFGPVTPRRLGRTARRLTAAEAEHGAARARDRGRGAARLVLARRDQEEWCDRRLLARIHRATLQRLRAEIQPMSPADFMRFLFEWQHLTPSSRVSGVDGLRTVIAQLDGFELAADAWDTHVLPARVSGYDTVDARPAVLQRRSRVGAAHAAAGARRRRRCCRRARCAPRRSRCSFAITARAWRAAGATMDHSSGRRSSAISAPRCLRVLERGAQFVQGIAAAADDDGARRREALPNWRGPVSLRRMVLQDCARCGVRLRQRVSAGYGAAPARRPAGAGRRLTRKPTGRR